MATYTGQSRTMQGRACDHCEIPEARCAWLQGCCSQCSHFRRVKPAVEQPVAPVIRVVRVPAEPSPHGLNLDDPLDRLYLELLPVRPGPPRMEAEAELLEELVNEVCPLTIYARQGAA